MTVSPMLELVGPTGDEVIHYYDATTGDLIASTGNKFRVTLNGAQRRFLAPLKKAEALATHFRLSRRAFRLDKSNAVFNHARDGVILLFRGRIFFFDLKSDSLSEVGRLRQCRNVLHGGIAVMKEAIIFGEYGGNPSREKVPVWRSMDDGRNWDVIYDFPAGSIKHIHGVYADPHSESIWIPTGDFSGECFVYEVRDLEFSNIVQHGDGNQRWRSVSMFFDPDRIVWAMDSQLETSCLQVFDRHTGQLEQLRAFEGPVWYGKRFNDNSAVLQTTVEVGEGVKSQYSRIYYSEDLINWVEVARFKKDVWPMRYFKFGVIAFADGQQNADNFIIFGEALKGLDGKAYWARILK